MFSKRGKTSMPEAKPAGSQRYDDKRAMEADRSAEASRIGRDIGTPPAVVNPERLQASADSLEFHLRTYYPGTFSRPFSKDHLSVIAAIESAIRGGGLYAYAMPRGSGKTSIVERAVLWALLHGYRKYIAFIGSDQDAAGKLLATIQTELETNDLLAEDFPKVIHPIRKLERIANRCKGQTCDGIPTFIAWTKSEVVLPSVADSPASGAIVEVRGITSGIRGMKFVRPNDGRSVRPDLIVLDDPQTDESSRSPSQCAQRLQIVRQAVIGLAAPGEELAGFMTATVITPDDMADQILNRDKNPDWHGKRTKLLNSLPANDELWGEYFRVRADAQRADAARADAGETSNEVAAISNAFYLANREKLDEGAAAAWPDRKNVDEISAIQHAMNLRAKMGDAAWFAECQNEPMRAADAATELPSLDAMASKMNNRPRGIVPNDATKLVTFVDVQGTLLPWMTCAFNNTFDGWIVDYGFFPDQRRPYFTLATAKRTLQKELGTQPGEASIYAGLNNLTGILLEKEYQREDGSPVKVDRLGIDVAWGDSADVIYKFIKDSGRLAQIAPMRGQFYGATSKPMSEYRPPKGSSDEIGDHWRRPGRASRGTVRYVLVDTNHWKTFAMQRMTVPLGGEGTFSVFGHDPAEHQMLFDQLRAERPALVSAKGRSVTEWKILASKPDNHLLDCMVGCHVLASTLGSALKQRPQMQRRPRRHISFREQSLAAQTASLQRQQTAIEVADAPKKMSWRERALLAKAVK